MIHTEHVLWITKEEFDSIKHLKNLKILSQGHGQYGARKVDFSQLNDNEKLIVRLIIEDVDI